MSMDNHEKEMYLNKIILSLRYLLGSINNVKEQEKVEKIIEQLEKIDVKWYN
jgi:hypothetical protein